MNSYRTVSSSPHADARTQEIVRDRVVRFYTEHGEPADAMLRVDADP